MGNRKSLESSLRQLEREKALLQHKSLESHRKAENEADRKRCLENEGERRNVYLLMHKLWVQVIISDFIWLLSNEKSRNVAGKRLDPEHLNQCWQTAFAHTFTNSSRG